MFRHLRRGVPLQDVLADVKVLVRDRLEVCALAVFNRRARVTASRDRCALHDGSNCSSVVVAAELAKTQVNESLMYPAAAIGERRPKRAKQGDSWRKGSN